jgi:hypothetical protein
MYFVLAFSMLYELHAPLSTCSKVFKWSSYAHIDLSLIKNCIIVALKGECYLLNDVELVRDEGLLNVQCVNTLYQISPL